MKNNFFLAWLVGTAFLTSSLTAEPDEKRTLFSSLKLTVPKLSSLAKRVQDKEKRKELQEIVQYANRVLQAGKHARIEVILQAKEMVEKALTANVSFKNAKVHKHSSSSSSSCKVCSELSELESDVATCCKELNHLLLEILVALEENSACDAPHAIDTVPMTIQNPGKYCVTKDLTYSGTGPAITVVANNVTINFHNHSLTLTNAQAQGIACLGVSEFTLEDDVIQGSSPFQSEKSVAVLLSNVSKATIDNIYTLNTTKGIQVTGSKDVLIKNSLVKSHDGTYDNSPTSEGAGVWVENSFGISIENTAFEGSATQEVLNEASTGLFVLGSSQNIALRDSSLKDWPIAVLAEEVSDMRIENVEAVAAPFTKLCLCQFGGYEAGNEANSLIIRNSTFYQPNLNGGFDGLLFLQGDTALLENVIVDTASAYDEGYGPAAIHIGCFDNGGCDPFVSYSNILADTCIVGGQNDVGLFFESAKMCTFTNSQFLDAASVNVYVHGSGDQKGSLGCQVKDSLIANAVFSEGGGYGVYIENSFANTIENCQVSDNGSTGIFIDSASSYNNIKANNVYGSFIGIENQDISNQTFFNTACNNGIANCIGVNPAQIPSDAVVVGSNVCCDFD